MAEYIDKERLLHRFNVDDMMNVNGTLISLNDARNIISGFPAVDVAPVVRARWLQTSKGAVYCSNCGTVCGIGAHIDEVTEDLNFCSSCGALMDGKDAVSAPQWINVKDKLPEPEQEVLVIAHGWSDRLLYIGSHQRMEAERSWLTGLTSKASGWSLWGWSYLREPEVTHWMPLPEPPKGIEKEEKT